MNQTIHRFHPLKEKNRLPESQRQLMADLTEVRQRLRAAENYFSNVSDPDLVEACIFEMNALETRYRHLLRQARQSQLNWSDAYPLSGMPGTEY